MRTRTPSSRRPGPGVVAIVAILLATAAAGCTDTAAGDGETNGPPGSAPAAADPAADAAARRSEPTRDTRPESDPSALPGPPRDTSDARPETGDLPAPPIDPSGATPPAGAQPTTSTTAGWVVGPDAPPATATDGTPCPSGEELTTAVRVRFGDELAIGSGVVDIRCVDRWATGWTNPDPADPLLLDPALVLFERTETSWRAVSGGMETDCLDRVPQGLWEQLDCF